MSTILLYFIVKLDDILQAVDVFFVPIMIIFIGSIIGYILLLG
jgi:type II secretory pathway component PulF